LCDGVQEGEARIRQDWGLMALLQAICEDFMVVGLEVMFETVFEEVLMHFLSNLDTVRVGAG